MKPTEILSRIVCSRDFSLKLIEAGIYPWAHLWHYKTNISMEDSWNVVPKLEGYDFTPGIFIPAWTKEELDVMLGPDVRLPQLPQKVYVNSLQDPNAHSWFGASMRIDYEKGADCSAAVVLRGLEEKAFTPEEVNKRYSEVFKLQERGLVGPPKFVPTFDPQ